MSKHKPIKFETTLNSSLKKFVVNTIKENKVAKTIFNATLGLIAVGGILTFGAVFPGILGEIGKIRRRQKKENYEQYQKMWHSFNYLKKQRALSFIKEDENGCLVYQITEKGKARIKKFIFDELKIENPKNWDGKWRLVIFDIPETKRKERAGLVKKLKDLGFYQCQKSAWIYPFPCGQEIEFIKDVLNIKPFVKLFLIEEIDDGKVLHHFKDLIKSTILK